MDSRTQERVERWDSRSYEGADDLTSLAEREFSGAVTAGGAWAFMLNGRVVGVVDGSLETVRSATSGTVYDAPDPALPLLCSMVERGGETRAQYYSNETSISEVDRKLQSASFTGYLELSEDVLSGDYYAVYYGGRRMAAAYVGTAQRLHTGDEAFERANDEVGIYEVIDVDVDVTDIVEPATTDEPTPGSAVESDAESAAAGQDSEATPDRSNATAVDDTDADGADTAPEGSSTGISSAAPSERADVSLGSGADSGAIPTATDEGDVADASGTTEPTSDTDVATDSPDIADERSSTTAVESDPGDGITTADKTAVDRSNPGITDAPADATDAGPTPRDGPPTDPGSTDGSDSIIDSETDADDGTDADAPAAPDADTDSDPADTPGEGDDSAASSPEPDVDAGTPAPDATDGAARGNVGDGDVEAAAGSGEGAATGEGAGSGEAPSADDTAADRSVDAGDRDGRTRPARSVSVDQSSTDGDDIDGDDTDAVDDSDEGGDGAPTEARFEEEARWRETRQIPSIDPEASGVIEDDRRSRAGDGSVRVGEPDTPSSSAGAEVSSSPDADRSGSDASAGVDAAVPADDDPATPSSGGDPASSATTVAGEEALSADMLEREDRIDQLTQRVTELESRRDELQAESDGLADERDELRAENQELSAAVDELEARIRTLETELKRARSETAGASSVGSDGATEAKTQLTSQEALAGTNLFVRYDSKSQPTLETAHSGDADRNDVAANLRLERHTQFDAATAVVDGQPYEEFLEETMEFQFVEWVVTTLPYEIRDTGRADGLADLYDVLPRIDRAELSASVALDDDDDAVPDEVRFDVVAFDKMGTPLLVANLNDSREPATAELLASLEEAASAVGANYPDLGGAFAVTSSFFEPGALEISEEATSAGFLSRGSKLSYVTLSRKHGYHLALVEARHGSFHVTVPEL